MQDNSIELNTITQGNCLDLLPRVASGSVDMVLCDLPYGTTSCAWDSVLPFAALWEQYNRVLKADGVVVLTATQPFTTTVISSNLKDYRYNWIWVKNGITGFANAKRQPLRNYEDVCVFYRKPGVYNPQGLVRINKQVKGGKSAGGATLQGEVIGNGKGALRSGAAYVQEFTGYPRQTLEVAQNSGPKFHPTQKPVALWEYLIRTYTNEGDTVLDNCCGSGTTGVACRNTGRNFIQFELDPKYCEIARQRLRCAGGAGVNS